MSVDLGLNKITSLELEKKILLVKLFDANELLNNVKTENMLLHDKVKNLELELSAAREQTNKSASSKLDHMLSVQKSPSNETNLGSSKPLISEVVKPSVSEAAKSKKLHLLGRLGLIFKSLNLRLITLLRASCMISLHGFVIFVKVWAHSSKLFQVVSCQASKQAKSVCASNIKSYGTYWLVGKGFKPLFQSWSCSEF